VKGEIGDRLPGKIIESVTGKNEKYWILSREEMERSNKNEQFS
jgi:hypothetical protein